MTDTYDAKTLLQRGDEFMAAAAECGVPLHSYGTRVPRRLLRQRPRRP